MTFSRRSKIGFFSIATNNYVTMLEELLRSISGDIRKYNWHFVVASNNGSRLEEFAERFNLSQHVSIVPCPPYRFPIASMLRFKYIVQNMSNFDFVCYIDADMKIEDPVALDQAISNATLINLVEHPGWARRFGLKISPREKLFEHYIHLTLGGLGSWETRTSSAAFVPRRKRKTYFAGGLFFGPAQEMIELSRKCDSWMDLDMQRGLIAKFHDESYLNRWATLHKFYRLGPEFCYSDFPWLPKMPVVVRAVDKTVFGFDTSETNSLPAVH